MLGELNLQIWQVLPAGPTGFGDSPYQALSAFAGNEMLIGLEPLVREGWLEQGELEPMQSLPAETVAYDRLIPLKRDLLDLAAERFAKRSAGRERKAYRKFREHPDSWWLDNYALFRVLKAENGDRAWTDWPAALAMRDPAAMVDSAKRYAKELERVCIIQFFFDRQWQALRDHAKARGIALFGDIPFYIALDSADAWSERGLLQTDAAGQPTNVAGVPPDYFSEDGQLWGNPLYDWKNLAKNDYRWWAQRIRQASKRFDMVRIDHFRGIESYWSVPRDEETARNGEWIQGPGDDFLNALTGAAGDLAIVAEDLGMITDEVFELRRRHALPGMRVLQFELFDPKFDPADIPEDCVCYTGTHDNDTTVGWFSGSATDKAARRETRKLQKTALRLTGGSRETIHLDMIRLAYSTPARVVIVPMQDYLGLGSKARLNNPGTRDGNWRWRMLHDQPCPQTCGQIASLVEDCSRI